MKPYLTLLTVLLFALLATLSAETKTPAQPDPNFIASPVGPKKTAEIATYPSLTEWHGQRTLWYPDRKYYLIGKHLLDSLLAEMKAP